MTKLTLLKSVFNFSSLFLFRKAAWCSIVCSKGQHTTPHCILATGILFVSLLLQKTNDTKFNFLPRNNVC